jgi:hypothetical protein
MVNLEILSGAAILAAPPIAREHGTGELAIGLGFKPQSRLLPFEPVQDCSSPGPATSVSAPREERRSAERAPRTAYSPRRLPGALLRGSPPPAQAWRSISRSDVSVYLERVLWDQLALRSAVDRSPVIYQEQLYLGSSSSGAGHQTYCGWRTRNINSSEF